MSAALGAKMLESEFYRIIAAPSADRWSRLDRFILGGPPLGNIHAGCRYALDDARSYMPAIVQTFAGATTCAAYLAQTTLAVGAMYGTSTSTQRTQLQNSGVRVNFFIGSADEFFGWRNDPTTLAACALTPGRACASGPSGVRNYLDVAGLRAMTVENLGRYAAPVNPTTTSTFTTMPGRTHSTLWDAETSTLVCRLISFDANNLVNDWRCSN
jgi:hypothetical protein